MTLFEKIQSQFHMPNAFEDWQDYRDCLTAYLIQETNTYPVPLHRIGMENLEALKPTLLIVGAGSCNDLDLAALAPHFSKIALLDSDQTSLDTALANYHMETDTHFVTLANSLNGITSSHYEDFCDHLLTLCDTLSGDELEKIFPDYACHLLEEYFASVASTSLPHIDGQYDFVWCVGVHSQLQSLFSFIYNVFEREIHIESGCYRPDSTGQNPFHALLCKQNDLFIPKLNAALLQATTYKCIMGFEAYRTSSDYEVLPELNATPIEGAYQGIQDLKQRDLERDTQYIFWPFAPANNQYYEMQIETIQMSS